MAKVFKCPECGEESEDLDYSCNQSGWQGGTYRVDSEDWEVDDSEIQDTYDYEYKCQNCDHDQMSQAEINRHMIDSDTGEPWVDVPRQAPSIPTQKYYNE